MTDFENVISFENLYKAHRRARLSKRHKKEVIEFEAHLSENLWKMHYDLKYGNYTVGKYHSFTIYDPKEREIQAIEYKDRVLQHSLCDNYLMPLLDKHLIFDNVACRKNRGTKQAFQRLRQFMTDYYKKYGNNGYFVKIDVRKYFPSIEHSVLKEKLNKIVDDEKMKKLLFSIIDSYEGEQNRGLPMGNQSSQCFALLYLDELDRYFKEKLKVKYYIRYMDDIILMAPNKMFADLCLESAEKILNKNMLKINPKSQKIHIKNGMIFLGWRFFLSQSGKVIQTVSKNTKKRIVLHIKASEFFLNDKEYKKAMSASYEGFLKYGNSYNFSAMCFSLICMI